MLFEPTQTETVLRAPLLASDTRARPDAIITRARRRMVRPASELARGGISRRGRANGGDSLGSGGAHLPELLLAFYAPVLEPANVLPHPAPHSVSSNQPNTTRMLLARRPSATTPAALPQVSRIDLIDGPSHVHAFSFNTIVCDQNAERNSLACDNSRTS